MPGQSKCLHLMGNTRVCRVQSVLGSSLLNNPQVWKQRCCFLHERRVMACKWTPGEWGNIQAMQGV